MKTKKKRESMLEIYRGLPGEIYFLFIARAISCLGRFIAPVLALILTQKIGMDVGKAGVLVTSMIFLQAPCVLLGGKLADSIGRKKIICIFFALAAVIYIICGMMPVCMEMAYLMILASCFSAVPSSAYDAFVADYTTEENRQAAFSLLYMGTNIGCAIAPAVAGVLLENHLRIMFLGDAFTSLLAVLVLALNIHDKYDIKEMQKKDKKQAEEAKESVFLVLRETPQLIFFSIIMMLLFFTYAQWDFGLPLCMAEVFGEKSAALYGTLATLNGIIVIFCTPLIVSLTKNMRAAHVIGLGGILYALCYVMAYFGKSMFGFVLSIIFLTLGEICITINYSVMVVNLSKPTHIARIRSVVSIISDAGTCMSPLLIGYLIEGIGVRLAMLVVAGIAAFGAVCVCFFKEK
ncbi:MAG: MFS transporter [Lachnospiraceae bacterium]|uniref:MFS transporter n=1 Tax=Roseburia hominis TaxID=301301 RepID=UPI001F47703C|nr:MFS transporter [Roseburia hominis]MDD6169138.1 MFS transporter [Lachnospiraceae bacterium]MDY4839803.1 MFS transporter [Lachnospiraceae bacterium]